MDAWIRNSNFLCFCEMRLIASLFGVSFLPMIYNNMGSLIQPQEQQCQKRPPLLPVGVAAAARVSLGEGDFCPLPLRKALQ